ncbi:BON domain-containing protein [Burkholderia sp. Bp8963]|uniref:BON domain-containing protein n=1 Tax=Burkholderia sp. Bp8963 TaxID=2184547 RepID=UPI0021AB85D0|nr:BON domain-containing protein [Burkholderia sp. Bp8963]
MLLSFALAGVLAGLGAPALAQPGEPGLSAASITQAAPPNVTPKQRKAADRKLMRRVSAALARTRDLNATRILVRVRDGNVTLAGSVADTSQATLAATVAGRVDGVVAVTNQLRVDDQPL